MSGPTDGSTSGSQGPQPAADVVHCSPSLFRPFDGFPGVCALARNMQMRLLWCNEEYARMCGRTVESLLGSTLHDLMTKEMADERTLRMKAIWESGKPGRYFQVWKDHRYLTNVWRLDPREFGCDGLFVLMTRGLGTLMPTLETSDMGVITTPHLDKLDKLSRRELEVLYLTALGMSTDDIARHIHRAAKTVENHIASIMEKLDFERRTELVRFAVERGILGFAEHEWVQIAAKKSDGRERD